MADAFVSALRRGAFAALFALAAAPAAAQFNMVPAPEATAAASAAATPLEYKRDAARHLYAAYPTRIFQGKLRPLLHGIMITETRLDANGHVVDVSVIRPPAALGTLMRWLKRRARA